MLGCGGEAGSWLEPASLRPASSVLGDHGVPWDKHMHVSTSLKKAAFKVLQASGVRLGFRLKQTCTRSQNLGSPMRRMRATNAPRQRDL